MRDWTQFTRPVRRSYVWFFNYKFYNHPVNYSKNYFIYLTIFFTKLIIKSILKKIANVLTLIC